MASEGPNSAGDAGQTDSDTTWITPGNILASDNAYNACVLPTMGTANTLWADTFGFSIPTDATIGGIKVEWERKQSSAGGSGNVQDADIYVRKAGSQTGLNRSLFASWALSDQYDSFGGSADLWGATWTAAEINAAGFGCEMKPIESTELDSVSAFVDHVRITVTYEETAGTFEAAAAMQTQQPFPFKRRVGGYFKRRFKQARGGVIIPCH